VEETPYVELQAHLPSDARQITGPPNTPAMLTGRCLAAARTAYRSPTGCYCDGDVLTVNGNLVQAQVVRFRQNQFRNARSRYIDACSMVLADIPTGYLTRGRWPFHAKCGRTTKGAGAKSPTVLMVRALQGCSVARRDSRSLFFAAQPRARQHQPRDQRDAPTLILSINTSTSSRNRRGYWRRPWYPGGYPWRLGARTDLVWLRTKAGRSREVYTMGTSRLGMGR
jgi:hypothetical protein